MPPISTLDAATRLAIGALIGLAVGIEREWSGHASGPGARFAGVRTFFLLGAIGAAAGWIAVLGQVALGVTLAASAAALTVTAYAMAARRSGDDAVEGTTEVAAIAVIAFGVAAGLGFLRIATASTAVIVLALAEKTRIESFVRHIGREEMRAALTFAVFALVVLPILPVGPYGPLGGIRPRMLWAVVLLFLALDFAGYIARRALGERAGYRVAGILGGSVSSTAVSLNFAQRSREDPDLARPLGIGVIGACTTLLPRVVLVTAVLNLAVVPKLAAILWPALVVGVGILAWDWLGERRTESAQPAAAHQEEKNPLRLGSALRLTVAFQIVLMAVHFVEQTLGNPGVLASAGILGLTDMDALTFSMARLGTEAAIVSLAARAIAIGILANTVLKLGVTLVFGTAAFRRTASWGLIALGAATGIGLWFGW